MKIEGASGGEYDVNPAAARWLRSSRVSPSLAPALPVTVHRRRWRWSREAKAKASAEGGGGGHRVEAEGVGDVGDSGGRWQRRQWPREISSG